MISFLINIGECYTVILKKSSFLPYVYALTAGKMANAIPPQRTIFEILKSVEVLISTANYSFFCQKNLIIFRDTVFLTTTVLTWLRNSTHTMSACYTLYFS